MDKGKKNTHTIREYYSSLKSKEILSFVTTLKKLESIMLNEMSQRKINSAQLHDLINEDF